MSKLEEDMTAFNVSLINKNDMGVKYFFLFFFIFLSKNVNWDLFYMKKC